MVEVQTQNGHANGRANGEENVHVDDKSRTRKRKAVIVGAGPVGCLAAIALANKGWSVEVYEGRAGVGLVFISRDCFSRLTIYRTDKRLGKPEEGQRSINLVLSSRGLTALYTIDPSLEERVMKHTIPIHSRMIHMKDGSSSSLQYDPHKQASPFFASTRNKEDKKNR